jgi:hypothetical protein
MGPKKCASMDCREEDLRDIDVLRCPLLAVSRLSPGLR